MYKSRPLPLPSARDSGGEFLTPAEFARASGLSLSTVWRQLRRGTLTSVKRKGRRFIPATALEVRSSKPILWDENHPMWKMIGCFKSGGAGPGSNDKYYYINREAEGRR